MAAREACPAKGADEAHRLQLGAPARAPITLGLDAARRTEGEIRAAKAYFGDGSCLSGLVGLVGRAGSGPLDSEAVGPPGVVAGTLP
jgi:hypothetical protein